jgi:hypothetical protein
VHRPQGGDTLVDASVIDNLVKGAAGQAVQNMNLMFGLDECCGSFASSRLALTLQAARPPRISAPRVAVRTMCRGTGVRGIGDPVRRFPGAGGLDYDAGRQFAGFHQGRHEQEIAATCERASRAGSGTGGRARWRIPAKAARASSTSRNAWPSRSALSRRKIAD